MRFAPMQRCTGWGCSGSCPDGSPVKNSYENGEDRWEEALVWQGAMVEMHGFSTVVPWHCSVMGDPLLGCWHGATVFWPFGQLILLPGATAMLWGPWDQAGDGLNFYSGGR